MTFWIAQLLGLAVAYLLGSIPAGYLAGRMLKGVDLRTLGSGGTGATNVLRTLGTGPFWAVLAFDVAKGAAAILLVRALEARLAFPPQFDAQTFLPWAASLAGVAAIVGHARPVWLRFQGGKSVAVGLGVLLALSWPVALGGLIAFGALLALTRIMSLGSIAAAVGAIGVSLALPHPLPVRLMVIAGGLYVIIRHRANLGRLRAGTEPRIGQRVNLT